MLFKHNPWDAMNKWKKSLESNLPIRFLCCSDVYWEKFFIKRHLSFQKMQGYEVEVVLGPSIDNEMLDRWLTPSLFKDQRFYLIIFAENISADIQERMINEHELFHTSVSALLVFSKGKGFWEKLLKNIQHDGLFVEEAKYWDAHKEFDQMAEELEIKISNEIRQYILKNINNSTAEFFQVLSQLQLELGSNVDNLLSVKQLLEVSRVDNFEMAKLLQNRKLKDLYGIFVGLKLDFEEWRQLFAFLLSHMIKIMDPDYVNFKKKNISGYDREIASIATKWSKSDALKIVHKLSRYIILCKQTSPHLEQELRVDYLRCL